MLYPAMRQVAASKGLTITEQARFHAMTSMSGADSLINCWAEKAHWNFWRPTTAIQLADTDGNDATDVDTGLDRTRDCCRRTRTNRRAPTACIAG